MSVIGSEPSDAERKILIQEFHYHVDQLLNQEDEDFLLYALKQYNTYRNVAKLVLALTSCLDAPDKLDLLPHIRNLISICDMKKYDSIAPYDQMANPPGYTAKRRGGAVRRICINRQNGVSLGVNVRGGWEHSLGIFVSSVDSGSLGQQCGLAVGDQIVSVNNISFEWISHSSAVKVLKANNILNITVSSIEKQRGQKPNRSSYVWVSTAGRHNDNDLPVIDRYKKVSLSVNWQKKGLGISLRGGQEYGIGIYISSVDDDSCAERCGLKVGDQIIAVNNHSFANVLHDEAVAILKSYHNLILTIRSVGKVPTIPPDEMKRSTPAHQSHTQLHSEEVRKYGSFDKQQDKPVAQVKPKVVKQLPSNQIEQVSSKEWYEATVSTPSLQFTSSPINQIKRAQSMKVAVSHSTPEVTQGNTTMGKPCARSSIPIKPSPLLSSSTRPPPKASKKRFNFLEKEELKFNSLPRGFKLQQSKAFIEGMGTQVMHTLASHISAKSFLLERANKLMKEMDYIELKEKLEQYENGMNIELLVNYLLATLDTVEKLTLLTEVRSVLRPADLATFDELVSPKEAEMLMVKSDGQAHGSLLTAIKAHGGVNCLRKTSTDNASKEEHDSPELGPFGSTEALDVLKKATNDTHDGTARRLESFIAWEDDTADRRHSLRKKYSTTSEVVVIELNKDCSTIGLSVDGGMDSSQKEIRVKTVTEGGAAYKHGFLKAGYEIVEVDGEVIRGMKHREACMAIHRAFKSSKPRLEMIVIPTHVHNTP